MVTTTNLGEAVGVQHAGLHDRTTANTVQGITHGLIIGKFKRGRTDQPMRINKDNIRARLGYEPVNPFYQVVQDCLDKFPSVWVLRVAEGVTGSVISCAGATNTAWFTDGSGTWDVEVNGVLYTSPAGWGLGYFVSQEPTLSNMLDVAGDGDCIISSKVTDQSLRVKLIRKDTEPWQINEANENPTITIDENGDISFCLAPVKTERKLEFDDQLSINASLQDSTISQLKYVMSGLYPVETIDELTVSASLGDGNLRQPYVLTPNDDMTVSAAMVDGDIRQILRSTTIDIDSMTVAASLSDGAIRQILRSTTIDTDDMTVNASLSDGDIKQILISTAIDTDMMTVSASLQDGELKNG